MVETCLSEGQYAEASAVLKQDYEIMARVGEVKNGAAKPGKTLNVRYAPPVAYRFQRSGFTRLDAKA